MGKGLRNLLFEKPWLAGLVFAFLPVLLLWIEYPLSLDSKRSIGKVTAISVSDIDVMAATPDSTVFIPCYEAKVNFVFEVDEVIHNGMQVIKSCDSIALKKNMIQLKSSNVTVIYNKGHLERAFLLELILRSKLKLTAGLFVIFFIVAYMIAGRIDFPNIVLREITMHHFFFGVFIFLFYAWLLFSNGDVGF